MTDSELDRILKSAKVPEISLKERLDFIKRVMERIKMLHSDDRRRIASAPRSSDEN